MRVTGLVALKKSSALRYVSQDHLTGTSVTSDTGGNTVASIKFFPFGDRRNSTGTIDTGKQFTGQRLDGTGLYYYGARYYDANIGRFISADSIVGNLRNPQSLNRYSYALNNPLRYIDPTGHQAGDVPDWALVQDPNGTVSWASDSNIQAAQQAGASIVQPWDVPEGQYGYWQDPSSSTSGCIGTFRVKLLIRASRETGKVLMPISLKCRCLRSKRSALIIMIDKVPKKRPILPQKALFTCFMA